MQNFHLYRSRVLKRILFSILTIGVILFTAACSNTALPSQDSEFAYVGTVKIDASQGVESLELMYGGKVIMHKPDAGLAIMGFSESEGELTTLAVEKNIKLSSPGAHASGNSAWSSGHASWANGNSSWASGYASWANGWSAWSNGTGSAPELPDASRAVLDIVGVSDALSIARNYGEGIKVAVIDTGFDMTHPMLANNLAPAAEWKDYVDGDNYPEDTPMTSSDGGKMFGHGTAVGGIIVQIAPRVSLLPIRVLEANGSGDLSNVIRAIDWAITQNANVINLSLGTNVNLNTLRELMNYASSQNVHIVMATGNASKKGIDFPAKYAKSATNQGYLLSVGSVDSSKKRSSFSNSDLDVEFLAPGENVVSAFPGNQLAAFSGTSFSTPIISGILALGLGETGIQKMQFDLSKSASSVIDSDGDDGFGIPNAYTFLQNLSD